MQNRELLTNLARAYRGAYVNPSHHYRSAAEV